jgi:GR25 family glycosyltransferase involved in LPS biosynthesis
MFTKILYINLDRRPDRKKHIEKQLSKINWTGKVERISAVDGRDLDLSTLTSLFTQKALNEASTTEKVNFKHGFYMTRGAIGCSLSHRKAWLNILNNDDEKVLILEDDIYFNDNFINQLNNYLNNIKDYDILYLGYHHLSHGQEYNKYYSKPRGVVYGLFGYIVNKRIAQKLLDIFPIENQIDTDIIKAFKNNKVYLLPENNKIIKSEESHLAKLGTDIQVIEIDSNQNENKNKNENENKYNILISLILIIIIISLRMCKNHN